MHKAANVYCTFSYFIQMRITNQTQLPTSCFFIYCILKIVLYQLIKFFSFYTSVISVCLAISLFTMLLAVHSFLSGFNCLFSLTTTLSSYSKIWKCVFQPLFWMLTYLCIEFKAITHSSFITYLVSFWSILLPLRKPATSAIIPLQVMSF